VPEHEQLDSHDQWLGALALSEKVQVIGNGPSAATGLGTAATSHAPPMSNAARSFSSTSDHTLHAPAGRRITWQRRRLSGLALTRRGGCHRPPELNKNALARSAFVYSPIRASHRHSPGRLRSRDSGTWQTGGVSRAPGYTHHFHPRLVLSVTSASYRRRPTSCVEFGRS